MSDVFEGVVGVNMESKYDAGKRRIKFEDNATWYGADESLSDDLGRGWKVKVKTEGSGKDAMVTKVKVLEKSAPKSNGNFKKGGGGGGGGKSQMSKEEWAAKDKTIQYQHCQKVGVSLLELALANGVVKLPAKGEKLTAFQTNYDMFVASVFADISGQAAAGRVAGETEETTDVGTDEGDTDGPPDVDDDGFDTDDDDF
jgi:hypothetical protein